MRYSRKEVRSGFQSLSVGGLKACFGVLDFVLVREAWEDFGLSRVLEVLGFGSDLEGSKVSESDSSAVESNVVESESER